ncbi:MAG TPA: SRPBCC family protein [Fimbriimonadales bacterium]|nr:SRPBCC family protein [Fimbriimonadales bacterium]
MPTIELTKRISAPIERVIEIARDHASYPRFMKDVESVEVIKESADKSKTLTRWVGRIPQFNMKVRWTQEDFWDEDKKRIEFRQTEGDYDSMSGYWEFRKVGDESEIYSHLEYEYNVPLLGNLLQKVVKHLVTANLDSMLEAIKQRAESA